jgi:hypothetical protein
MLHSGFCFTTMSNSSPKHLKINARDFSSRAYFPGTEAHPFHHLNLVQNVLSKIPAVVFPLLIGTLTFLISGERDKSIVFLVILLFDWLLLCLLPKLRISFGPSAFSAILLALLRLPFFLLPHPFFTAFQISGVALIIYGFFVEPQFPKVEKYNIYIPCQDPKFRKPIRIVHLSDLHMSYFTRREDRLIRQVNALEPDLILFSGDFFNLSNQRDPLTIKDVKTFFNQLNARYGVFGVTGSPAVDLEESVQEVIRHSHIQCINNRCLSLDIDDQSVEIIGLECTHQPQKDYAALEHLLRDCHKDATRILLYHSPDIAPELTDLPIALQLSGHTHGGQVRLPFFGPFFTSSLYGLKFNSGHYRINGHIDLIISRGIGLEGNAAPRVRFLAPPEVGLITLEFIEDNVQ